MNEQVVLLSRHDFTELYDLAHDIATEKAGTYHTAALTDARGKHRVLRTSLEHVQDLSEVMLNILMQYGDETEV